MVLLSLIKNKNINNLLPIIKNRNINNLQSINNNKNNYDDLHSII